MANKIISFPGSGNQAAARRLVPSRLRDARLACRLNQSELASAVGITRQAISAFEQGEKGPDPGTLISIAKILDQPLSFFTADDGPLFGDISTRFLRAFGPDTKRRNLMCEVFAKWFVQMVRYFDDLVNFPEVDVPSVAPLSKLGRYTVEEIEEAAEECRRRWGLGIGPISNLIALLETKGIILCRYEVQEEEIEAFSFWSGSRSFIFLSSRKDSAARARFDAAHELGHLILHRWVGPEELEDPKTLKLIEAEANRFAGAFLLPRKSFPNEIYSPRLDAFVSLKRRWKVAIQAMIYRCKDLGIFDEGQITNLYKQISYRKWRTNEPLDDELVLEQPRLLRRVVELVLQAGKRTAEEISAEIRLSGRLIAALCAVPEKVFERCQHIEKYVPSLK